MKRLLLLKTESRGELWENLEQVTLFEVMEIVEQEVVSFFFSVCIT